MNILKINCIIVPKIISFLLIDFIDMKVFIISIKEKLKSSLEFH